MNKLWDKMNKLDILVLQEENDKTRLFSYLYYVIKKYKKICYISLSNTYKQITKDFKKNSVPLDSCYFVDTFTAQRQRVKNSNKCAFLTSPDIKELLKAIHNAIEKHNCNFIVIDHVSALLNYYSNFEIQKFTHVLCSEDIYANARKSYIIIKESDLFEDELNKLISNLELLADRIIDLKYANLKSC